MKCRYTGCYGYGWKSCKECKYCQYEIKCKELTIESEVISEKERTKNLIDEQWEKDFGGKE